MTLLTRVTELAEEILESWDKDDDMRVGKTLKALSGYLPGYRADIDELLRDLGATPGTATVLADDLEAKKESNGKSK